MAAASKAVVSMPSRCDSRFCGDEGVPVAEEDKRGAPERRDDLRLLGVLSLMMTRCGEGASP